MTAKEYFEQARDLDNQIRYNLRELERLRELSQSVSSPSFEEPHNASRNTQAPFVEKIEKILQLEESLSEDTDQLIDLRKQIWETIHSLSNSKERMVLQYRYLDDLTWEQISLRMHVTESTVRRWHHAALSHVVMPKNPIQLVKLIRNEHK